jgi:cytochrome b561
MSGRAAEDGYSGVAKLLHWLVLALLVVQFAIAWAMPEVTRDTKPVGLIAWHLSVGSTILVVMLVRLGWRLTHSVPPPPSDLPVRLQQFSRATHFLLYAMLIVLPFMGWANASSRDWPVRLFGFVPLPPLVSAGSAFGHTLGGVHAWTAIILLAVAGLHISGALYHAVVLRDRTLQRMLP